MAVEICTTDAPLYLPVRRIAMAYTEYHRLLRIPLFSGYFRPYYAPTTAEPENIEAGLRTLPVEVREMIFGFALAGDVLDAATGSVDGHNERELAIGKALTRLKWVVLRAKYPVSCRDLAMDAEARLLVVNGAWLICLEAHRPVRPLSSFLMPTWTRKICPPVAEALKLYRSGVCHGMAPADPIPCEPFCDMWFGLEVPIRALDA